MSRQSWQRTLLSSRALTLACLSTVGIVWVAAEPTARAANYTTCIRWQAQTIDSGHGEDRLTWANGATSLVTAYGARVRVSATNGSGTAFYDASPATGCFTWPEMNDTSYTMRVYYISKDSNKNLIRYHDGGEKAFGSYPGYTYYYQVSNYTPSKTKTTYLHVGGWSPRATAISTASMVNRYFSGVHTTGKQIHMTDNLSCGGSSAHYCSSNCNYSSDAYVRLRTCGEGSDHRRRKFVTAHELGHARAINYQGKLEPNYDGSLDEGECVYNDEQTMSGYTMDSREYDVVGMREGFAHFTALWTYNRASEDNSWIRWFNTNYDGEKNDPHLSGGRMENTCGGAETGQTTNVDAMRMYWDWSTPTGAANRATRAEIMKTYRDTVLSVPAKNKYWEHFVEKAEANVSSGVLNKLCAFAVWNGVEAPVDEG